MPQVDDEQLLDAARAGDRDALETLLGRYQARVYGFGMRMCRNSDDAEDVLQDTLLAAARGIGDFRGKSSLSTWLYAVARSFCLKRRRRGRSVAAAPVATSALDSLAERVTGAGPEELTAQHEVETVLSRAIGSLAPRYREVLVLRDVEGLTAPEVAEVLGIGVAAVKSRLHRARVLVRHALAPLLGEPIRQERQPGRSACPDVLTLFSRHLEGEISSAVCAQMQGHVEHCDRCRQTCSALERSLEICRNAPAPQVPEAVQRSVRAQLHTILKKS